MRFKYIVFAVALSAFFIAPAVAVEDLLGFTPGFVEFSRGNVNMTMQLNDIETVPHFDLHIGPVMALGLSPNEEFLYINTSQGGAAASFVYNVSGDKVYFLGNDIRTTAFWTSEGKLFQDEYTAFEGTEGEKGVYYISRSNEAPWEMKMTTDATLKRTMLSKSIIRIGAVRPEPSEQIDREIYDNQMQRMKEIYRWDVKNLLLFLLLLVVTAPYAFYLKKRSAWYATGLLLFYASATCFGFMYLAAETVGCLFDNDPKCGLTPLIYSGILGWSFVGVGVITLIWKKVRMMREMKMTK